MPVQTKESKTLSSTLFAYISLFYCFLSSRWHVEKILLQKPLRKNMLTISQSGNIFSSIHNILSRNSLRTPIIEELKNKDTLHSILK